MSKILHKHTFINYHPVDSVEYLHTYGYRQDEKYNFHNSIYLCYFIILYSNSSPGFGKWSEFYFTSTYINHIIRTSSNVIGNEMWRIRRPFRLHTLSQRLNLLHYLPLIPSFTHAHTHTYIHHSLTCLKKYLLSLL